MSIYDYRDRPAYHNFDASITYCDNPYIDKWWTIEHDRMIKSQIEEEQWNWAWKISESIIQMTPLNIIEKWKSTDPLCKEYAWYNVLMYYSIAKAKKLDYLKFIRSPEWKMCQLCGNDFIENSIPSPFIEKLGINNLEFCSPCLRDAFLKEGNSKMSRIEIINYLKSLTLKINKVPPQNYINEISNLSEFDLNHKQELLKLLRTKPTIDRVKKLFGSWFKALIEAEILEDGTRRLSRGTQCLAKDGHICYSLAEKTIDDLLFALKIPHTKEPKYPEGNYRGDFLVENIIIEYFGLVGNVEYDKKIEFKRQLAKKHNLTLIEVFPIDMIDTKKLIDKLRNKQIAST